MSKYFALLTRLGADRLANAAALGTKIEITHMAVGDGNGSLPTPDSNQTRLINEKRRAAINVLSVDPKNTNQIIAEQVIPEHDGGWWIREIGLFDKDGVLIAIANCAETYKPQLQEGSGRTQTIRMVLIVSHTESVTLKIDPSVVLATREYADTVVTKAISEHEKSRRHPDATLKEKGFVVLSNAIDSSSETQAATPKAIRDANATRLEKAKNGSDIPDAKEFVKNLGLGDVVRGSRKINGKSLTSDVNLTANDVGAQPKGNYADGSRFQINPDNAAMTPSQGTYALALKNDGALLLWDGSSSVFRVSPGGEITEGSMAFSRLSRVPIVQTTGNSATSFMSQRAVTETSLANGVVKNVVNERAANVRYVNNSSRARHCIIIGDFPTEGSASVEVDGIMAQKLFSNSYSTYFYASFIVPVGKSYVLSATSSFRLGNWTEIQ
jgi:hypothetical protein